MRDGKRARHLMIRAGVSLLAVALCGCVDYEERVELNPDGKTGLLKIHLAVDERFVAVKWPKVTGSSIESIFPTTLEDIRKEMNSPALELVDARASVSAPMRHLYLVCRIKDVGKLNESPALAHRAFTFKQDSPTTWTCQQQLDITGTNILGSTPEQTAKALTDMETKYGRDNIRGILSKYRLTLSVSMPEDVAAQTPNGAVHGGSTVIWQKSLTQLLYSKEPWKMEAHFAKER